MLNFLVFLQGRENFTFPLLFSLRKEYCLIEAIYILQQQLKLLSSNFF